MDFYGHCVNSSHTGVVPNDLVLVLWPSDCGFNLNLQSTDMVQFDDLFSTRHVYGKDVGNMCLSDEPPQTPVPRHNRCQ